MTINGLVLPSVDDQKIAGVVGADDLKNAAPGFIELVAGVGKQG